MRIEDLMKSVPTDQNAYNVMQSSQSIDLEGLMSRGGRKDRRTVPQTKALIKEFIRHRGKPVLILEICEFLDRKPTPHFRGILREMVAAGDLTQEQDTAPGSILPRYWFSITSL